MPNELIYLEFTLSLCQMFHKSSTGGVWSSYGVVVCRKEAQTCGEMIKPETILRQLVLNSLAIQDLNLGLSTSRSTFYHLKMGKNELKTYGLKLLTFPHLTPITFSQLFWHKWVFSPWFGFTEFTEILFFNFQDNKSTEIIALLSLEQRKKKNQNVYSIFKTKQKLPITFIQSCWSI